MEPRGSKGTNLLSSRANLLQLADWQPIAAGFGRGDDRVYEDRVVPLIRRLEALPRAKVCVFESGSMANYAWLFLYDGSQKDDAKEGLHVYLSLLAPIAAMGKGTAFLGRFSSDYRMIEPGQVQGLEELEAIDQPVASAVEAAGFRLLSTREALEALPSDVIPSEYCLNDEPWDRMFHLLFANTD